MNTCNLAFTIEPLGTVANLKVQVKVDQHIVFDNVVLSPTQVSHSVSDDDGVHTLTIELSGKTDNDTQIDSDGNIIADAVIKCSNFAVDNINVDQLLTNLSTYTHSFNSNADQIVDTFYGVMGCNGIVQLEFTTPIYLWVLENT